MSRALRNRVLFLLFFVSGFCGLAYQVVWLRLAFASFGIITPVVSVVISVFMLGLALGSVGAGRFVERWTHRRGTSAIFLYALAEVVIGFGAFAVPHLFDVGEAWLLPLGPMGSSSYLAASGLILGASLLPWCVAMGTTFPLMMAFVRELDRGEEKTFSFLYFSNVLGAMAGVAVTAGILIELLGFRSTLVVAAVLNFSVAAAAIVLGRIHGSPGGIDASPAAPDAGEDASPAQAQAEVPMETGWLAPVVLFTTGFCSMGLEVVWTRAFVPIIGTLVYSFASLLFTYLLATWVGSWLYRRHLAAGEVVPVSTLLWWLALSACLPILLNDPRVFESRWAAMGSIFPLCALLGYLTPKLVDEFSAGNPDRAGRAYAVNVFGSIIGPLAAAYVLLPVSGARFAMLVLGLPFLLLALSAWRREGLPTGPRVAALAGATALFVLGAFVNVSVEEGHGYEEPTVYRDHTATVISSGSGRAKALVINGVSITSLVPVAKVMAHLPLGFLQKPPEAAAVICLGMGTTFRSLMSWGIDVTAVELAGGVAEAFRFFHDDAESLLSGTSGRIAVDDGRRFLQRTGRLYDVITIDPPPPPEAAGSSLLYSKDFYVLVRRALAQGGILHQWYPGGEPLITSAITRSLVDSFTHVRAFQGYEGGIHYLASMEPLETPTAEEFIARMPETARRDLVEWNRGLLRQPTKFAAVVLRPEVHMPSLLNDDPGIAITDDRPFNEYYVMRRAWAWLMDR